MDLGLLIQNFLIKSAGIFQGYADLKWKPGEELRWGSAFALVSTGEEKLWIPSKLIKI